MLSFSPAIDAPLYPVAEDAPQFPVAEDAYGSFFLKMLTAHATGVDINSFHHFHRFLLLNSAFRVDVEMQASP